MNEREKGVQLENMRLALQRQMEQQQVEAFKPLLKNYSGPVKIQSSITEEMVKEYEKEKNKPIEIDGKYYRNHPLIDELELEEYEPAYKPGELEDETTIEGYKERINEIKNEINDYNDNIQDNINKTESKINEIKKNLSKKLHHKTRTKYIKDLEKEDLKLVQLAEELRDDNPVKLRLFNEIKAMNDVIDENNEKINKNVELKQNVDKINDEKRRERIKTIQFLNMGKFNIERGSLETDEQYLKRLEDAANIEVSADVVEKEAEIDNIQRLKSNLKDIIRNESRIENIVKSFNAEDIYILNTNWVKVKKLYVDTYGTNNKNLTAPEITAVLVTILEDIKKKGLSEVLSKVKTENVAPEDIKEFVQGSMKADSADVEEGLDTFNDLSMEYDDDIKALHIHHSGVDLYLKVINKGIGSKAHKYLAISYEPDAGNHGKYTLIKPTKGGGKLREYANYLGVELDRLRKNLGIPKQYFLTYDAIPYVESKFPNLGSSPLGNAKIIDPANKIWGFGMNSDLPDMCKFGNVFVNLDKLYHKNILSVSNHQKLKIMGFPNTRVSDSFVSLIMKICKNQNVLPKDINDLSLNEKELYDHLLHIAKLHKDLQSGSGDQTIAKLKHRYMLIQGQIDAGNNNPELLRELYEVLTKMVNFNLITQSEFKRYYKQVMKKFNI